MIRSLATSTVLALLVAGPLLAQSAPVAAAPSTAAPAAVWQIDPLHSELSFQVRHLISRVRGTFGEWSGTIVTDANRLDEGSVEVAIQAGSIDTGNDRRDGHLRSGDFFDAENHPEISFRSDRVEVNGRDLRVHGLLTMRGVTRPVVLEGRYLGTTRDGDGNERIGFEAETTVDRQQFGVSWNELVEGASMVGDEVTISMVVAGVRR